MFESTLRLIPEPALQSPESGQQWPDTAFLGFGPDMADTWQLGRLLQGELETQGILYDPKPGDVANLYAHGRGSQTFLDSQEVAEKIEQGRWSGTDIADNLLKGMYWARLESQARGPLSREQVWMVGSAVGAAYNTQHGLWGENDTYESKSTILMHSYLDGHDRFLVRGSDTDLEFNRDIIDARSNRRPGIATPATAKIECINTKEFSVVAQQRHASRARAIGTRLAAAASLHL